MEYLSAELLNGAPVKLFEVEHVRGDLGVDAVARLVTPPYVLAWPNQGKCSFYAGGAKRLDLARARVIAHTMKSYSDVGWNISDPAAETFSFIVRVTDMEEGLTADGHRSLKSGEETAKREWLAGTFARFGTNNKNVCGDAVYKDHDGSVCYYGVAASLAGLQEPRNRRRAAIIAGQLQPPPRCKMWPDDELDILFAHAEANFPFRNWKLCVETLVEFGHASRSVAACSRMFSRYADDFGVKRVTREDINEARRANMMGRELVLQTQFRAEAKDRLATAVVAVGAEVDAIVEYDAEFFVQFTKEKIAEEIERLRDDRPEVYARAGQGLMQEPQPVSSASALSSGWRRPADATWPPTAVAHLAGRTLVFSGKCLEVRGGASQRDLLHALRNVDGVDDVKTSPRLTHDCIVVYAPDVANPPRGKYGEAMKRGGYDTIELGTLLQMLPDDAVPRGLQADVARLRAARAARPSSERPQKPKNADDLVTHHVALTGNAPGGIIQIDLAEKLSPHVSSIHLGGMNQRTTLLLVGDLSRVVGGESTNLRKAENANIPTITYSELFRLLPALAPSSGPASSRLALPRARSTVVAPGGLPCAICETSCDARFAFCGQCWRSPLKARQAAYCDALAAQRDAQREIIVRAAPSLRRYGDIDQPPASTLPTNIEQLKSRVESAERLLGREWCLSPPERPEPPPQIRREPGAAAAGAPHPSTPAPPRAPPVAPPRPPTTRRPSAQALVVDAGPASGPVVRARSGRGGASGPVVRARSGRGGASGPVVRARSGLGGATRTQSGHLSASAPDVDMTNVNTPQDVEQFRDFGVTKLRKLGLSAMRTILRAVREPVETTATNGGAVQKELADRIQKYFDTHDPPPRA
ncbi:unnamed protein product [Pelagomonas calceolata]|uniref:Uncharacterized protein n=1 Tax=Pelagomonas calceolata TaxID=35677 RepID=A0A8J2S8N2_9STRA|nr:unnamed protein product [Pelagomonas calceolata]